MTKVRFVVPGPPVPAPRVRVTKHGTYTPARYTAYKRHVQACAAAAFLGQRHWNATAKSYRMSCSFYMDTLRRVDGDNLWKSIMDSLNKLAFEDDSMVTEAHIYKGLDRERPRVEIELEAL